MKGIHHVEVTDSTNDLASELARKGALDGTVVLADAQSAGRGRLGRDWFSPASGNIYLSYVHRSRLRASELSALTLDAASAVASALEDMSAIRPDLKWPNDLLVGGRKIAGILTELHTDMSVDGSPVVIIGVGVNVALESEAIPAELQDIATSVHIEAGESPSPRELAELIARRLREKLAGYEAARGPDMSAYMTRFPFVGAQIMHEGERRATISGVGADGSLMVNWDESGEAGTLWSGEIQLLSTGSAAARS